MDFLHLPFADLLFVNRSFVKFFLELFLFYSHIFFNLSFFSKSLFEACFKLENFRIKFSLLLDQLRLSLNKVTLGFTHEDCLMLELCMQASYGLDELTLILKARITNQLRVVHLDKL